MEENKKIKIITSSIAITLGIYIYYKTKTSKSISEYEKKRKNILSATCIVGGFIYAISTIKE